MSELLMKTLESLNKRMDENKKILVQKEEGYLEYQHFSFNHPANEKELLKLSLDFPSEYKIFLKICNGARLFFDPSDGGGLQLYSIEEILEDYQYIDYPPGWFPIGYGLDGCRLIIKPDTEKQGSLYWLDNGGTLDDPTGYLNFTFEKWFDYFIVAQGCKFWEWSLVSYRNGSL